ncbi:HIT family protein [Actinomadura chibensis]|uniref:HIT domain-containing protein n=1 Tax=Actinomadura chibensis TaxID=392828 RepID=A0A5D0N4R2_9ACTN|nr:hypothetical protein [Actinomadura chibensis]TYB39373.1 hypothetical protein FXF69_40460 [Actinomadura chibensis]
MVEPTPRHEPGHDCVLCPPLRFRFNEMADLPGEAGVVARDADFLLMPDVAPLAEGHLLLVTREHQQCAAAFAPPLWERALRWRDRVARLYRRAYGSDDLLLFEHGPASPQGGGACIDHAHWHFLPGAHGVRRAAEDRGLPGAPAGHAALRARFRAGRSYLLIEEDGVATVHPGDGVRSQFLRWAVTAAGRPGGAWRWQETFGLPASRRRFLLTLRSLRAAVEDEPLSGAPQSSDSHQ